MCASVSKLISPHNVNLPKVNIFTGNYYRCLRNLICGGCRPHLIHLSLPYFFFCYKNFIASIIPTGRCHQITLYCCVALLLNICICIYYLLHAQIFSHASHNLIYNLTYKKTHTCDRTNSSGGIWSNPQFRSWNSFLQDSKHLGIVAAVLCYFWILWKM